MKFETPEIPSTKEKEGSKPLYETSKTKITEEMEIEGFVGNFSCQVSDDGDSYVVRMESNCKEGIDPFDITIRPTSMVLKKDEFSLEDAIKKAEKMQKDMLEGNYEEYN